MAADGSIIIDVVADTNRAASALSKLAKLAVAAFSISKIIDFSKKAIQLGSDIQEVQNVVDVAFGDMSNVLEDFADNAIYNFGMSELAAKRTASTYMAMASNMGLTREAAAEMSLTLTGLTGDVASFYNISQELADIKLKSVFTGETETLKDLGIVMTQANLETFALSQGITKSISAMSQAELVTLRYNFVLDQLSLATGDFVRTQDSWANQTRILSMQWEQFMSVIGQSLIQVLLPVVQVLNRIVSALIDMANAFNAAITAMFGGANAEIQQTQTNVGGVASGIGDAVDNQNALTEATKETNKEQQKSLAAFDEINTLSSGTSGSGGAAGGAGGGLDLGGAVGSITYTPQLDPNAENVVNQELVKFFQNLYEAIQPTIDALSRLWDQLKLVGSFAGDALKDFYNTFLVPVGKWVFGEGLPRFIDAIRNGLANIDFQRINDALHKLWEALAPFAINVGDGLLWLWENVLVPMGAWVGNNLVPLFIRGIAAALTIFNEIWEVVKPGIEWLWTNFLLPVAQFTGGIIVSVLEGIVGALERFGDWCSENRDLISDIAAVIASFAAAWALVNLPSIITGVAVALGTIVATLTSFVTTSGLASAAATVLGGAINFLTSPINLVILAIGAIIAAIVLLVRHWDEVKNAASSAWEWIKNVWSSAGTWFNENVVTPIANFFGGLWEGIKSAGGTLATWMKNTVINPIVDAFKWLYNSVVTIIEGVINGFIGIINGFIKGINGVISTINKIPGINLGKISTLKTVKVPRLAQGAVIPPNREFLAVLGDQKAGTNIEAPLDTIKQALLEAMREAGGTGNGVQQINLVVDGRTLAKVVVPQINRMTQQAGKPVLNF